MAVESGASEARNRGHRSEFSTATETMSETWRIVGDVPAKSAEAADHRPGIGTGIGTGT